MMIPRERAVSLLFSHALTPELSSALRILYTRHKFYVAGGCAHKLVSLSESSSSEKSFVTEMSTYLTSSDIDLFFHDSGSARRFVEDFTVLYGNFQAQLTTPSGLATEFRVSGTKIQAITGVCGKPVSVMSTFDLTAAQVAFDLDHNFYFVDEERWTSMLKRKELCTNTDGVHNKFLYVHRVHKWMIKHGYKNISEKTSAYINSIIDELAREIDQISAHVTHAGADVVLDGKNVTYGKAVHILKISLDYVSPEQVLVLWPLLARHRDKYTQLTGYEMFISHWAEIIAKKTKVEQHALS